MIVDDIHGQTAGALRDNGHRDGRVRDARAARCASARCGRSATQLGTAAAGRRRDRARSTRRSTPRPPQRPAKHPRVLAVIDREAGGLGNLVAVGPGSWVDELLAVVGGDNVLVASGVRYPKISLEEVLRGQPDVILDLSSGGSSDLAPWRRSTCPPCAITGVNGAADVRVAPDRAARRGARALLRGRASALTRRAAARARAGGA